MLVNVLVYVLVNWCTFWCKVYGNSYTRETTGKLYIISTDNRIYINIIYVSLSLTDLRHLHQWLDERKGFLQAHLPNSLLTWRWCLIVYLETGITNCCRLSKFSHCLIYKGYCKFVSFHLCHIFSILINN